MASNKRKFDDVDSPTSHDNCNLHDNAVDHLTTCWSLDKNGQQCFRKVNDSLSDPSRIYHSICWYHRARKVERANCGAIADCGEPCNRLCRVGGAYGMGTRDNPRCDWHGGLRSRFEQLPVELQLLIFGYFDPFGREWWVQNRFKDIKSLLGVCRSTHALMSPIIFSNVCRSTLREDTVKVFRRRWSIERMDKARESMGGLMNAGIHRFKRHRVIIKLDLTSTSWSKLLVIIRAFLTAMRRFHGASPKDDDNDNVDIGLTFKFHAGNMMSVESVRMCFDLLQAVLCLFRMCFKKLSWEYSSRWCHRGRLTCNQSKITHENLSDDWGKHVIPMVRDRLQAMRFIFGLEPSTGYVDASVQAWAEFQRCNDLANTVVANFSKWNLSIWPHRYNLGPEVDPILRTALEIRDVTSIRHYTEALESIRDFHTRRRATSSKSKDVQDKVQSIVKLLGEGPSGYWTRACLKPNLSPKFPNPQMEKVNFETLGAMYTGAVQKGDMTYQLAPKNDAFAVWKEVVMQVVNGGESQG